MIELRWPPKELNPNSRTHWAKKSKLTKAYRMDAGWLTKASGLRVGDEGMIDVKLLFHPPDRRRRDMDGMLSSIKAGLDGIADGLKVNDHRFRLHLAIGEMVKGGRVDVEICCNLE